VNNSQKHDQSSLELWSIA